MSEQMKKWGQAALDAVKILLLAYALGAAFTLGAHAAGGLVVLKVKTLEVIRETP